MHPTAEQDGCKKAASVAGGRQHELPDAHGRGVFAAPQPTFCSTAYIAILSSLYIVFSNSSNNELFGKFPWAVHAYIVNAESRHTLRQVSRGILALLSLLKPVIGEGRN